VKRLPLACRKYRRLSYEVLDRALNPREEAYLERHEARCYECQMQVEEGLGALAALRMETLEPEPRPYFDERVLRRLKVQTGRTGIAYWSPAVIGGAVASLVVLAALQMIAQSSRLPSFHVPGGEARLVTPAFPTIENAVFRHSSQ
jgi:hypothetical protein